MVTKLERLHHIQVFPVEKEIIYKHSNKLCLVYSIWSHTGYANSCFYSILSQLVFTDITDYNIIIFVDTFIEEHCRNIFKNLIPQANIIGVDGPECAKQRVCINDKLKDYEVVVISDADNFMQANHYMPIYKDIYNYHKRGEGVSFLKKENGNILDILKSRMSLSNFTNEEEYLDFFKAILKNDSWYLSGFMSFNTSLIDEFKKEVELCSRYNIFCDESVWLGFLAKARKQYIYIPYDERLGYQFVGPENIKLVRSQKEDGVMYLVHPFLGNFVNRIQLDILHFIKYKFKLKYGS